jgi:tetratricopeptide (TPR) repeat protein
MMDFAILLFAHVIVAQPEAATVLNQRCVDSYVQGDYPTAERLCRESISRWTPLGTAYAPNLAVARTNLAQALAAQGRRAEARDEVQQAVAVLHASPGPREPHTLYAMNLLAALDVTLGDNDASAELLLDEALRIERALEPAGLQLSRTLHVLACLRIRQHRFDEALPLADEALRIAIQVSGDDSTDAALTYGTAAEVHRAAGHPDRALPLYRHSRAIYEKKFGPEDLRVAPILTQESLILIDDHKFALAEQQLRHSLAILDRACPHCVVERCGAEGALALLRTRQGKYAEADRLFTHVLAVQQSTPVPASSIADTIGSLAFVRSKEK